jgi:hypothetical protein
MRRCVPEEQVGVFPGPVFKREVEGGLSAKKIRIDPAVKELLDKVLVPAMVRLYLAGTGLEADNGLVKECVQ